MEVHANSIGAALRGWIVRRPLLACAILAAALRVGAAILTEYQPIFPAYYYTDTLFVEGYAQEMVNGLRADKPYELPPSPSQRIQTAMLVSLYLIFGDHPLAGKIVSSLAGGVLVALLGWGLSPVFGEKAALRSCLLAAVWPSHVFFTSQNFKDVWAIGFCYLALGAVLRVMEPARSQERWREPLIVFGGLFFLGFFRTYLLGTLSSVAAAGFALLLALRLRRRQKTGAILWCLAAVLLAPAVYVPVSRALMMGPLKPATYMAADPVYESEFIPHSYDYDKNVYAQPFSPQGIARMRKLRQAADRYWAWKWKKREIGSQLFPELEFESWLDVLLFLPKGIFYALFMPLPLLYPVAHSLGRSFASVENVGLLFVALAAIKGVLRGPKSAARMTLVALFGIMAAGSGLFEFDLGGATRHRLLYMPFLFPFAFSLLENRKRI